MRLLLGDLEIPPPPIRLYTDAFNHRLGYFDSNPVPDQTPLGMFFHQFSAWYTSYYGNFATIAAIATDRFSAPFQDRLRIPLYINLLVAGSTAFAIDQAFRTTVGGSLPFAIDDDPEPIPEQDTTTTALETVSRLVGRTILRRVSLNFGGATFAGRYPVKIAANPDETLWNYLLFTSDGQGYRGSVTRTHVKDWREVMLETYPRVGDPPFPVAGLFNPADSNDYFYTSPAMQLASGTRYSPSLIADSNGIYFFQPSRFWTLGETLKTADANWQQFGNRVTYGGRIDERSAAVNMPAEFIARYTLPVTPNGSSQIRGGAREQRFPTGLSGASGTEPLRLSGTSAYYGSLSSYGFGSTGYYDGGFGSDFINSDATLPSLVAMLTQWELQSRRVHETTFSGLVPWGMTPLDRSVQWRIGIPGLMNPSTTVYSASFNARRDQTRATLVNPEPPGATLFVRFTKGVADETPLAGMLERVGVSSSPPFTGSLFALAGDAPGGARAIFRYDDLTPGNYKIAPGSPWVPDLEEFTLAVGEVKTVNFLIDFPPPPDTSPAASWSISVIGARGLGGSTFTSDGGSSNTLPAGYGVARGTASITITVNSTNVSPEQVGWLSSYTVDGQGKFASGVGVVARADRSDAGFTTTVTFYNLATGP